MDYSIDRVTYQYFTLFHHVYLYSNDSWMIHSIKPNKTLKSSKIICKPLEIRRCFWIPILIGKNMGSSTIYVLWGHCYPINPRDIAINPRDTAPLRAQSPNSWHRYGDAMPQVPLMWSAVMPWIRWRFLGWEVEKPEKYDANVKIGLEIIFPKWFLGWKFQKYFSKQHPPSVPVFFVGLYRWVEFEITPPCQLIPGAAFSGLGPENRIKQVSVLRAYRPES